MIIQARIICIKTFPNKQRYLSHLWKKIEKKKSRGTTNEAPFPIISNQGGVEFINTCINKLQFQYTKKKKKTFFSLKERRLTENSLEYKQL